MYFLSMILVAVSLFLVNVGMLVGIAKLHIMIPIR